MNATEPTRTSTPLSPSDPLSNRPTFTTMTTLRKALVPSLLATSLLAASTAAGASGLGEKVVINGVASKRLRKRMTVRQAKKQLNFPARRYAIRA